jgi:hypothetical protein
VSATITDAEQGLATARGATDSVTDRLAAVEEGLAQLTARLAEVDSEIVTAIEAGEDASEIRMRRGALRAELEEAKQESAVLTALRERRKAEENAAVGALETTRREVFRREAVILGDEIRQGITEVIERVEKFRALAAADDRSRSTARGVGVESPAAGSVNAAGLVWIWSRLEELTTWRTRLDSRSTRPAG